ncbi:MAG: DUF2238 domain-containing protein [Rhodobacteraceae bacterium]|nr:DUF2238 domain-containing protein [Paracoccaceae bacterium]
MKAGSGPRPAEWAVIAFTGAYVAGFALWFLRTGNLEFMVYVATMAILAGLLALTRRLAAYPVAMLWALSLWGLMHMAGGSVPAGDSVLYNLVLVPLAGSGELSVLKYDQAVHAYGFGVTAWLVWHVLVHRHPSTRGTVTALLLPPLAAMGLGTVNEIIEFVAVLSVPKTNVGGYLNTALDLVFNAIGAAVAMVLIVLAERLRAPARPPA